MSTISECIKDLGFKILNRASERLEIEIAEGMFFIFENIEEDDDNAFGFKDTPWHSHDKLILTTKDNAYVELNDMDIFASIKDGDILICEQYVKGILTDRWLKHKNEKDDNRFIEAGEEIIIRRFPFHTVQQNGAVI